MTPMMLVFASAGLFAVDVEAWMQQDALGRPIQVIRAPVLAPGTYEVDTANLVGDPSLFPPDTVLAIRTRGDVGAQTLWGADECETQAPFEAGRSCVRFHVDAPMQPYIWVWSHHQLTQGEADIRIQQLDSLTATRNDNACPEGTVGGFCWQTLATAVPFGGITLSAHDLGDNLDRILRLETGELPGAELAEVPSEHAILFFDGSSQGWNLLANEPNGPSYQGAPYSHDRQVAGTAQWVGLANTTSAGFTPEAPFVLAGPLGGDTGGPFRLLRNDRVELHTPNGVLTRGTDWDGDGLGEQLEAWLGTCDSASSPDSNGFICAELPGCDGSDNDLCRAASRDSDQDALRDDHELFGVTLFEGTRVEGMELARYGTDPATFDVLVELDYLSEPVPGWFLVPEPICSAALASLPPLGIDEFATPVPGYPTAEQYYALRLSADALPIPVPPDLADGNEQCWVYGVTTTDRLDPESLAGIASVYRHIAEFENRSGVTGIAMHFDAGVPPQINHRGIYGDWGGSQLLPIFDAATPPEDAYPPPEYLEPQRRWLFRHVNYTNNGGGKSPVPALRLLAGSPYALAHELGHSAGLTHEGPAADPRKAENYNPFYLSRINYLYEGIPVTGPSATVVTFSSGAAPGPFNPVALDERCPFGPGQQLPDDPDIRSKIRGSDVFDYDVLVPNCQPIDWDLDGNISDVPVQAPLWPDHRRAKRTYFTDASGNDSIRSNFRVGIADLAVGATSLVMAAIDTPRQSDGSYRHRPYIMFTGAMECAECTNMTNNCWSNEFGEKIYLTDATGAPIEDAEAIAVTWVQNRYVWVVHRGDHMEWGEVGESDGTSASVGTLEYQASTLTYETALALETVGTDQVVLAYRQDDGTVRLARSQPGPLGGRPSLSWSATPEIAQDAAGDAIVATPNTAVGLGMIHGSLVPAGSDPRLVLAVSVDRGGGTPGLTLFDGPPAGTTWTVLKELPHQVRARPDIAQTSYSAADRLFVSWQKLDTGESFTVESLPNDITQFLDEEGARLYSTSFPNPIVWDERVGVMPGLRAWYCENKCSPGSCPEGMACVGQGGNVPGPGEEFLECRSVSADGTTIGTETNGLQFLLPFNDGVLPVDFHDMDDRPALRYNFCSTLRTCEGWYDGSCTPTEWLEADASGSAYGTRLCAPGTYEPPICVPRRGIDDVDDQYPGDDLPDADPAPDFLTTATTWIRGAGLWGEIQGILPGSPSFVPDDQHPPEPGLVGDQPAIGYDQAALPDWMGLTAWQQQDAFATLHDGTGGTLVMVFATNSPHKPGFIFDTHHGDPTRPGFSLRTMPGNRLRTTVGSAAGAAVVQADVAVTQAAPHFVIFRYDPQMSPQWSIFVDQGMQPNAGGNGNAFATPGPSAEAPRLLARSGAGATLPFDGRVAELATFDRYIDDDEVAELADYLATRYGIE